MCFNYEESSCEYNTKTKKTRFISIKALCHIRVLMNTIIVFTLHYHNNERPNFKWCTCKKIASIMLMYFYKYAFLFWSLISLRPLTFTQNVCTERFWAILLHIHPIRIEGLIQHSPFCQTYETLVTKFIYIIDTNRI